MITRVAQKGLNLIKEFEGCSLKAYADVVNIWTIGYGNTFYKDGTKVRSTDKPITQAQAMELLLSILKHFEDSVNSFTRDDITQNQFDALVCFSYNVGTGALKSSTLLKKVNANPNDLSIQKEFEKWNKAGGKAIAGLTRRRKAESELYFS